MPSVKGFHAQPSGSMVCGAYALTAILDAFDRLPVSSTINLQYDTRKSVLLQGNSGLVAARNIYAVTGCGPMGYNMPSAMGYVAQQFGLKASANFTKTCRLLANFPSEKGKCKTVGLGGTEATFAAAGTGQCQAICVYNAASGLHWLALGENGLYMDPGDGKLHNWAKVGYTTAGLWMSFSD